MTPHNFWGVGVALSKISHFSITFCPFIHFLWFTSCCRRFSFHQCPMKDKFSFLIRFTRIFSRFFLIVKICFLVDPVFLKASSLLTFYIHGIFNIRRQIHIPTDPNFFICKKIVHYLLLYRRADFTWQFSRLFLFLSKNIFLSIRTLHRFLKASIIIPIHLQISMSPVPLSEHS